MNQASVVAGRYLFYNNSFFDTATAENPDLDDDTAIATDKSALQPGDAATSANYTNYDKGINGIIVDIAKPPGTPTAADFEFRVGNNNDSSTWAIAPDPTHVTVRPGEGLNGSDRITITWPDNAIGEAGDSTINTIVNATDEIAARNFQHSATDPAPIDDPYDYNRDGLVNGSDQIIARSNQTNPLTMLRLITLATDLALEQGIVEEQAVSEALPSALNWQYEYENARSKDAAGKRNTDVESTVDMLIATDWV